MNLPRPLPTRLNASLSNTTTTSLNTRRAATSVKIKVTFGTRFDYLLRLHRVASSNTRDMSGAVELLAAVSTRTRRSHVVACA